MASAKSGKTSRPALLDLKNLPETRTTTKLLKEKIPTEICQSGKNNSFKPITKLTTKDKSAKNDQNEAGASTSKNLPSQQKLPKKFIKKTKCLSPIQSEVFQPTNYIINPLIATRSKYSLTNKLNKYLEHMSFTDLILLHIEDGYKNNIYKYLLKQECSHLVDKKPKPFCKYENEQRSVFIEWLMKVHEMLRFDYCTYFVTVRIFDLIITEINIPDNMLQLVGLAVYFLITKYFHGDIPYDYFMKVCQLERATSFFYKKCFLKMEKKMLKFLNFDLNIQEPSWFVAYYASKFQHHKIFNDTVIHCTFYILECFTLSEAFSSTHSWNQAAVALGLSMEILSKKEVIWEKLEKMIDLDAEAFSELKVIMRNHMINILSPNFQYSYVIWKYQNEKYHQASDIVKQYFLKTKQMDK